MSAPRLGFRDYRVLKGAPGYFASENARGVPPPQDPLLWASGPHWLVYPINHGKNLPLGAGGP